MTPRPPQGNTPVALLARKRTGRKWLELSGTLVVGHVIGTLAAVLWKTPYCGFDVTASDVLGLLLLPVLLPLSAGVATALGPLVLVVCGLTAFRVQGGTQTAVGSILLGIPLLYTALIWGLRRWWKTESPRARLLYGLALAGYNALVTFCVLFFGFSV